MKGIEVHLTVDEKGCDEELLSDVTYFLQQELRELDCVAGALHGHARPSLDSASADAEISSNTLIIDLIHGADPSTFVTTLAAWLARKPHRSMQLRMGEYEMTTAVLTPKRQEALINWFKHQLGQEFTGARPLEQIYS